MEGLPASKRLEISISSRASTETQEKKTAWDHFYFLPKMIEEAATVKTICQELERVYKMEPRLAGYWQEDW